MIVAFQPAINMYEMISWSHDQIIYFYKQHALKESLASNLVQITYWRFLIHVRLILKKEFCNSVDTTNLKLPYGV